MVKKVNIDNYRGVDGMSLKKTNMTKMLLLYRYISLILTSIFFIVGGEGHNLGNTLIIIMGTTLTALTTHYLYRQSKRDKTQIQIIILLEVIGNCIILMCSGGLHSPYMWYILNTMIMAGIELGPRYMWANMVVYIGCVLGYLYCIELRYAGFLHITAQDLNLIAGFGLISVMVQLLIDYLKALEEKSNQIQNQLDYTLKIYRTVYLFTNQEDRQKLIEAILNHMRMVRKLPVGMYLDFVNEGKEIIPYSYGVASEDIDRIINQIDMAQLSKMCMKDKYGMVYYQDGYTAIPIRYTYYTFGMLIVKGESNLEDLKFIAYVSGMMMEKIALEELNEQLLIGNEQNRIANEIHDSVIQQLFGVSCQLYNLEKQVLALEEEKIANNLKGLRGNITDSMAELRATIYGMSWNKQGKNNLIQKLENFIKVMEGLHPVTITLKIQGNLNSLNLEEQKALYRVCCEGVANGIKHGCASQIDIDLHQDHRGLVLRIEDNGKGFDYNKIVEQDRLGLGIKNMEQLTRQIGGEFDIHSIPGEGTMICAEFKYYHIKEAV